MPRNFFRHLFCGNGADIKDAILESASVWRDLTFGVAEVKPLNIPEWVTVTSSSIDADDDDDDGSSILLGTDDEEDDDTTWLLPEHYLGKIWPGDRQVEESTDEDLFSSDDDDDDGSSYAPSPQGTWRSTKIETCSASGVVLREQSMIATCTTHGYEAANERLGLNGQEF